MTQQIRPSQFIFTYGPGAILESPSGPVIVKDLRDMLTSLAQRGKPRNLSDIEIQDQRFTSSRLHPELQMDGPWRILRIPSNAELGWAEGKMVYPVASFPNWSLCTRHQHQDPSTQKMFPEGILYESKNGCPKCGINDDFERRRRAGAEAYRFVRACPEGHLDDVPWVQFVHAGASTCGASHVIVRGHGGALEEIRLSCPVKGCPASTGRFLIDLYREQWSCSGRHPHRFTAPTGGPACTSKMTIQQRGALALFQPEVVTSLTLEPVSARLLGLAHHLLPHFRTALAMIEGLGMSLDSVPKEQMAATLSKGLLGHTALPAMIAGVASEILADWGQLVDMLLLFDGRKPADDRPRKYAEYDRLMAASENGAPVVPAQRKGDPPLFEVRAESIQHRVPWGATAPGPHLRVAPVSRLREVAVQAGFRRMVARDDQIPRLVSCWEGDPYPNNGETHRFFPGVERYGEGLFFRFEDDAVLKTSGPKWATWMERWQRELGSAGTWDPERAFRHPVHPLEVWWHTLSHRLIRTLSLDAGYSSSALRERLFFVPETPNSPARSGLLIYAVQSGGDGTLGGLTSLAPDMNDILDAAVIDLDSCSNGPVCDEGATGDDGSACYACLYASETSCEFRNRGLDRLLLLETLT